MPEFTYKARNTSGKFVNGRLTSASIKSARNDLTNRGFRVLSIQAVSSDRLIPRSGLISRSPKGELRLNLGSQMPSTKELAVFSKQFSLMIENGIPLLQCLRLLAAQQQKTDFKATIEKVASDVEKGSNLSDALEPHKRVFDELYVALIRAGEKSGHLDKILRQLVNYIEKSAKIKAQIRSAMTYPAIIVFVAVSVITLLLVWVVPSFAKQFADSGKELPALTIVVMSMANALIHNWMSIIGGLVSSIFAIRWALRTDQGKKFWDTRILKTPIFGTVMLKIAVSRFSSTMGTMLSSGVSILESLNICAASSGNKAIEKMIYVIRDEISKGKTFHDPMEACGMFPMMVSSMVAVGEQTGTLDITLTKISDIYDDEVDSAIDTMTSMIEPLLIVVIGGVVGFIVIAMYLPIFSLADTVGG